MDQAVNRLRTEVPQYLDELYNFCVYMTGSHHKGEKLLQGIIEDAVTFSRYHESPDLRKWLLRIGLNLYNRSFRVPGEDSSTADSQFENLPAHADKALVTEVFKNLTERDLFKLFTSMPSAWREVLVLKEILNLNYWLISELLDIPVSAVIMRLARGRRYIYLQAVRSA